MNQVVIDAMADAAIVRLEARGVIPKAEPKENRDVS